MLTQFLQHHETTLELVTGRAVIGATGAVTLQTWLGGAWTASAGKGIASITRTGTGAYTIQLQRGYSRLLSGGFIITNASGEPTSTIGVKADSTPATGAINIVCSVASTPTDPENGDVVSFFLLLADGA